MSVKVFNTRIQLKNDTAANWSATPGSSLVLLPGEFAWDSTNNNFKVGDGTKAFSALNYAIPVGNNTEITSSIVSGFPTLAIGHIDGSKINALTGYTTTGTGTTGNVTASDTLLQALAKIENKADTGGVTSFGGATGAITLGTHLSMDSQQLKTDATGTGTLATTGDITTAIEGLDVTAITGNANQTITSISETDGKISATYSNISIPSSQINDLADTYSSTGTVAITGTGVAAALGTLDASTVATAVAAAAASGTGTTVTLKGVKEDDGIISQGDGTAAFTIGDGALKLSGYGATDTTGNTPTIPTVSATEVFSANDTADSTIALGNEFVLDATNKAIGLRTKSTVSASNAIVTEADIASLSGAMHYKGGITAYPTPTADTKAGDTYVVTTGFSEGGVTYEVGDMLVAKEDGASTTYTVVQSNMTLGVGAGQVAANSAALTSGKIVIASGTGIETSSYSVTDIASEAVSVSASNGTVTVSDTLTVGGTSQQAQTFTITGGNGITASASDNAITISHSTTTEHAAAAVKVGNDQYGHVVLGDALASTDITHSATIGSTDVTTVSGAIGALETLAEGAVQDVKTLKTSASAQSKVPSGEALEGTGDVVLHDIAKTGNTNDLIQGMTFLFNCGSATTVVDQQ